MRSGISGRRLTADPAASFSTVRNPFLLNIIWKLPAGLLTALLPVLWFCYYPHSNAALRFFLNPPGGIFFLLFHLCPLIPHRNTIRVLCLVVISFGVITNIAGMDLSALWDLSDFANILMVYCNLPLQYIGFKYVLRAWEHFEKNDGTAFTSKIAGIDVTVWDERAKMK